MAIERSLMRLSALPLFQHSIVHASLIVAFASSGCSRPAPAVPRVDFSQTSSYGVTEFKDNAPANADVGQLELPLTFVDAEGQSVDLAKYRGKQKVVLIVLRGMPQKPGGAFCPSCLAQTSSLLANQQEFIERSVAVLVVYPGPTDRLGEFLAKAKSQTSGEPAAIFQVLLDQECLACAKLGIRDDLAKPSTYILDSAGKLVYAYVGETSTDRPSIKAIVNQLDRAK